jgi:hypothetical protein
LVSDVSKEHDAFIFRVKEEFMWWD